MKKRIEFPLVELMLLIILIAAIIFFAMPRYLDIGTEARIKSLNAIALNISSVNRLLYSRSVIKNVQLQAEQSSDILGEKDAGVTLVYGELGATKKDLMPYVNSILVNYVKTDKPGAIRLYFDNYRNEACYITYQQAYPEISDDGQTHIKKARYRVKSTGC